MQCPILLRLLSIMALAILIGCIASSVWAQQQGMVLLPKPPDGYRYKVEIIVVGDSLYYSPIVTPTFWTQNKGMFLWLGPLVSGLGGIGGLTRWLLKKRT